MQNGENEHWDGEGFSKCDTKAIKYKGKRQTQL